MCCGNYQEIFNSQYSLCPVRLPGRQGIPSPSFGARRRLFFPAAAFNGGLFCCLYQSSAQHPAGGYPLGHCLWGVPVAGCGDSAAESEEVPARRGIWQCPMGNVSGHRPLYGFGFLPEYPHDTDRAHHHGKQTQGTQVRPEQEHSGHRRFRQRQDAVLL